MERFTLFHFYLIFFFLGLGYSIIAVLLGQVLGDHGGDGHGAGGVDGAEHGDFGVDHGDFGVDHDVDVGHGDVGGSEGHDWSGGHDAGHGGHEAGHDAGGFDGMDAMPNISPLSPVTLATFATSFGGVGVILDKIGLPVLVSFPISAASGFVIAAGVFYLFYRIFSITQSTSGVSERHAIGREATVITAIPQSGTGEIAYILGGRRFNAAARCESGGALRSGASVVISRKAAGVFYVRESAGERIKNEFGE